MRVIPLFGLMMALVVATNAVKIPEIFKICSRDDPDLNDCLKDAIQTAQTNLKDGYKDDVFDIRAIHPYVEKEMKIEYTRNQIAAKAILKNIKAYGLINAVVHDVRANIQDDFMELEIDMSNKRLFVDGFFRGEGRLNAIVLNTKGFYNTTMSDLTWTWKISGTTEEKNGNTYLKIKKFFMRPEVGHIDVNLPVIFENNPELDRIAVNFAKTYWKLIYQELLPVVEQTWSRIGISFCNRIFGKIPYDQLFPIAA